LTEAAVPTRQLPRGARMPVLGLGVWQMAAGAETEQAVEWALELGYRHIDTATMYRNEQSVGAAVARSGLPREEIFVTTKLLPTHTSAERELRKSLDRLKLDYVDLYLIHWPVPLMTARCWRQLESLQERGLAREIGVSNFGADLLESLRKDGRTTPAVNQVHYSVFRHKGQPVDYLREHGIVLEAYSPLERGKIDHPTIAGIADEVGRPPAQVMLRWAVQHDAVVIPKSTRRERIESNARIFDFELDDGQMKRLDGLDA
jgi:diketogulonate reductase-like aldo/keto reductase